MAVSPCPGSRRISRLLCSSGFRFQYPRHFVGDGGGNVFLEIAGQDKKGIAHAGFRHAIGAAGCPVSNSRSLSFSISGGYLSAPSFGKAFCSCKASLALKLPQTAPGQNSKVPNGQQKSSKSFSDLLLALAADGGWYSVLRGWGKFVYNKPINYCT